MSKFTRRDFLKLTGSSAAVATLGAPSFAFGAGGRKVVVVGGGVGGATAAKYIRLADPSIDVTLIEPNHSYHTCFLSNEVLGGVRSLKGIEFGYDGLKAHGVKVVHDTVTAIDHDKKSVVTSGSGSFAYDRCVVSPGISFRWDTLDGYDATVAEKIPHAWKAGPQTATLRNQLTAMKDGGTVVISPPPNPFRCPPGPYERAAQIAHYLKHNKPKSKILILDPKEKFSKFGLFKAGWARHYGFGTDNSMIEWVPASKGGKVVAVSAKDSALETEIDTIKGDVLNVIPAQKAGAIAATADLVNEGGWCPVHHKTFESSRHAGVHVIGDASIAKPLPKSGYAANSEAKVCAAAVVALLNGKPVPEPSWVNTCYSLVAPGDGFSVAMVYRLVDGKVAKVKGSGGLTAGDASAETLAREAKYAYSWFNNVTADIFG